MTWYATDSVLMALLATAGRGFVLLAAAALAALALRRAPASARHWVWTLAVAGLLALPVASALAPEWRVTVPEAVAALVRGGDAAAARGDAPFPVVYVGAESLGGWDAGDAAAAAPAGAVTPSRVANVLLGAWAAGSLVLLSLLALGHLAVRGFERRSGRFAPGPVTGMVASLRRRMGIRRDVRVLRGAADAMPMSWGVWRPVILLPQGAERWSEARLRTVLLHELAHVARRDCLTQLLAELAVALHWPNPLAWLAARRLRVEREHACDDVVVLAGPKPSEYATELLDLAGALRVRGPAARLTAAMARPAELHGRLRAILEEGRSRAWSAGRRGAAAVVCAGCVMATAALTPGVPAGANEVASTERDSAEAPSFGPSAAGEAAPAGELPPAPTEELPPRPQAARIQVATVPAWGGGAIEITPMAIAMVRGRVLDAATDQPIANATVRVTSAQLIAVSGSSGVYALIDVPAGTHELVVERDGYVTQTRTVAVTADAELVTDFRLEGDGTRVRLRTESSMTIGRDSSRITIRGVNGAGGDPRPVIFIDGVRIMNDTAGGSPSILDQLDPNDIERVEVIKGEAAVQLYGPEAAGGVIQIFLKDGAVTRIRLRDGTVTDTIGGASVSAADMFIQLGDVYRRLREVVVPPPDTVRVGEPGPP